MKHQTQTKKKEKTAKNSKSNYKKENASFGETKLRDTKNISSRSILIYQDYEI